MKTLFKLFIVAAFSIISLSSIAQTENVFFGEGTVKVISDKIILILSGGEIEIKFDFEGAYSPLLSINPGDKITFTARVLPNGKIVFTEIKKID